MTRADSRADLTINVKRHKKCRGAFTINVAFEPL